jgi:hypothetical protein
VIYGAVGRAAVLVLRGMRKRWAASGEAAVAVPYGPNADDIAAEARP